jgi:hypothetical protein
VAGLESTAGHLYRDILIARHTLAHRHGLASGEPGLTVDEFIVVGSGPGGPPTTLTHRVNLPFLHGKTGDPGSGPAEPAALQPAVDKVPGPDHPRAPRTRRQRAELLEYAATGRQRCPCPTPCCPT